MGLVSLALFFFLPFYWFFFLISREAISKRNASSDHFSFPSYLMLHIIQIKLTLEHIMKLNIDLGFHTFIQKTKQNILFCLQDEIKHY